MQTQLHNYPVTPYNQTAPDDRFAPAPKRGLALGVYNVVKALGGASMKEILAYLPAEGYEKPASKVAIACRNLLYTGQLVEHDGRLWVPKYAHYKARQDWLTKNTETAGAQNQKKPRKRKSKRKTNGNGAHGPAMFRAKRVTPPTAPKQYDRDYALALALGAFSGGAIVGTAIGLLIGGM